MTRIRIVGGTITKTTAGAHHMYSEENIVFNSHKTITEVGEENGIVFGEPKDAPKINKNKKISSIYWTYGEEESVLNNKSRFYTDMNLHVKTFNYEEKESITVIVKFDDGIPLNKDLTELKLTGNVTNNTVVFKKVLKDYTIELFNQ